MQSLWPELRGLQSFIKREGSVLQNTGFVIENGVLTKYIGPGGDVAIPEGVTEIGKSAFYDCAGLTSVTIP